MTERSGESKQREGDEENAIIEMRNSNEEVGIEEGNLRDEAVQGMSRSSSISSSNSEQNGPDQSERWIDNLDAKFVLLCLFYIF